jgi:hypothetical protein
VSSPGLVPLVRSCSFASTRAVAHIRQIAQRCCARGGRIVLATRIRRRTPTRPACEASAAVELPTSCANNGRRRDLRDSLTRKQKPSWTSDRPPALDAEGDKHCARDRHQTATPAVEGIRRTGAP